MSCEKCTSLITSKLMYMIHGQRYHHITNVDGEYVSSRTLTPLEELKEIKDEASNLLVEILREKNGR